MGRLLRRGSPPTVVRTEPAKAGLPTWQRRADGLHERLCDLVYTFTLDETAHLASGPSLREAIETVDAETGEDRPDFYGINCSHPIEFLPALEPGDWTQRIRILRPNAALMDKVSLCRIGHLEEGDPRELGLLLAALARRYPHIDIWGGCCGTWDKHLHQIARDVRAAHANPQ